MKKKSLAVIFFTVFIDLVGFGIIIPLSPYLGRAFGADAVEIGALMSIYSGMQFIFAPFWGALSDRWGRRPVILIGLMGSVLAHLMFGFAQSLSVLFLARALAGISGANISTAMAYMADVTGSEDRAKGMGLIGAAFGLGFIIGPALGGALAALGVKLGAEPPWGENFAAIGASAICLINFVFAFLSLQESLTTELKAQARARRSRLANLFRYLKQPGLGGLMVAFFLTTLAMAHIENAMFLLMKDDFAWDLTATSFGFAYVGLIMVITQGYIIRKILPLYGERRLMVTGLLLSMAGFALIGLADQLWFMAVAVTFLGFGVGLSNPTLTGSISLLGSAHEQGEVLGTNQSLSALARVVGPLLGGWFYRDISHGSAFFASAIFVIMALSLVFLVWTAIPHGRKVGQ